MVYLVAGPAGAGKSWVCNQLESEGLALYVQHDQHEVKQFGLAILKVTEGATLPIVADVPFRVSVLAEELRPFQDMQLVYIVESMPVIKERLLFRDGPEGVTLKRLERAEYMNKRAEEQAGFKGTADEVLEYMRGVLDGKL